MTSPTTDSVNTEDKARLICDFSDKIGNVNFMHRLAMFLWVGWFFLIPMILILLPILYYRNFVAFSLLLGIVVLSGIYPTKRKLQPKIGFALGRWLMTKACEYFGIKIYQEDPDALRSCGPALIALEPHDVLPFSMFCFNDFLGFFPGQKLLGCLTSICFSIPLMKHVYTWASATSVDKKNIMKMLKRGVSPVICPGGAQEVTYLHNDREYVLFLRTRFGLARLALKFGYCLVPTFAFGQRQTYDYAVPRSSWLLKLGRKAGFIPLIFFGMMGLPLAPPKSTPITLVVGAPIPCPKIENPTQADLEEYQNKLIKATEDIFQKYKARCGMENATLIIK